MYNTDQVIKALTTTHESGSVTLDIPMDLHFASEPLPKNADGTNPLITVSVEAPTYGFAIQALDTEGLGQSGLILDSFLRTRIADRGLTQDDLEDRELQDLTSERDVEWSTYEHMYELIQLEGEASGKVHTVTIKVAAPSPATALVAVAKAHEQAMTMEFLSSLTTLME